MNALHDFGKRFGKDTVAQPPAGHRIELGESVDHERFVREFQDGMRAVFVNQAMINFVGDNILFVELSDILQLFFGHDDAGRIGRRIDHNRFCP
jgi:hypothetical protein